MISDKAQGKPQRHHGKQKSRNSRRDAKTPRKKENHQKKNADSINYFVPQRLCGSHFACFFVNAENYWDCTIPGYSTAEAPKIQVGSPRPPRLRVRYHKPNPQTALSPVQESNSVWSVCSVVFISVNSGVGFAHCSGLRLLSPGARCILAALHGSRNCSER